MNTMIEQDHTNYDFLVEGRILRGSPENYRASIQYKGLAFRRDVNTASMTYDIKRARAMFDPNLAGGNGGWRCPVGTRYGGQITDRYGRGCGWGAARRLANAISDTGERLEGSLERRQNRRTAKRSQRTARRIGKPADRIARRASRGVDQISERDRQITPRTRRGEGVPETMDRTADEVLQGNFLANRRARRQARNAQRAREAQAPRARRERRGAGVPERMDEAAQDVLEGRFMERRRKRRDSNRRRRERAQVERTTPSGGNRPPAGPTTPVGTTQRPTRRRGPRVDAGEPGSERRQRFNEAIAEEAQKNQDWWRTRLRDVAVNKQNIREYIAEREKRANANPAYLNTLRARERDHEILTGRNATGRANDLSPTARKSINDRLNAPKKDRTPETPETPEAPTTPKKPKPEVPEAPAGPRTSNRRVIGIEDVTDDPGERRRILGEVSTESAQLNRNYDRLRKPYVSRNDDEGLKRLESALEREHDRLGKIADDKSKPVEDRYRAREKMRVLQDQKMKMREAREGIIKRRRASEEAANTPEAPSGPPTPRTPDTGSRVETYGLDKKQRNQIDEFVESDKRSWANQRREIERLARSNEDPTPLIARRRQEANRLLEDYLAFRSSDNADPQDRYLAARSLDALREHKEALDAMVQTNVPNQTPSAPDTPQAPDATPEIDLLIPSEERQKELRTIFAERAKAILDRREKIIGRYMSKRYGSGDAPWKDPKKNPDIATLSKLLDTARLGGGEGLAAKRELEDWAKSIYEVPEFEGKNGMKFRTRITSTNVLANSVKINGTIEGYDEAMGRWRGIGELTRELNIRNESNPNFKPYVKNWLLKINSEKFKDGGFASVYNPHAFTWLKAAGFDHAKVGTAWDGRFVWGKLGYRESSSASKNLAQKLEAEIQKIRNGGRSSVINKRDADIIAALIDDAKRRNFEESAPQHAEYLMAMSNRDQARVKSWFTRNAPFNNGVFRFDEISEDPR